MLTEVNKGRLSLERLIDMTSAAQARLFDIQLDNNTYTEVDMDAEWIIDSKNLYTKCGWTPFDGWKMKGKVHEVVLRGITVFKDGKVIGKPLGVIKNR
jgi:dihydroorotase-like cyclic amidohydrolase